MRTPVTLKIKFKSTNLDQFIERYSVDVSRGGIFIRTKEPLTVGTHLKFEFQLQDASALISGEGTVVWIREHDPARSGVAPGMGVRFDKLSPESTVVLDKILNEKQKRGESQMESRFDAGVRASAAAAGNISTPAPAPAPAAAAAKPAAAAAKPAAPDFGGDSKSHTPLPAPAPGLTGQGDEFGEESTRVMQDAMVQALADKTRGEELAGQGFGDQSDTTRRATPEQLAQAIQRGEGDQPSKHHEASPTVEVAEEVKPAAPAPQVAAAAHVEPAPAAHTAGPVGGLEKPFEKESSTSPVKPLPAAAEKKSSSMVWVAVAAGLAVAGGGYVMFARGVDNATPSASTAPAVPTTGLKQTPTAVKKIVATAMEEADPQNPGAAEPAKPTAVEPAKPAGIAVAIASEPAGATVTVDGKPAAAPTPTNLEGLDAAKVYEVVVSMKGFKDWKVKLKPKAGEKLQAALVPVERWVEISSTPVGADVLLDGKMLGKTPYTIRKFDASKPHEVAVKRVGFVAQTRSISAGDAFEAKGDKEVLALALTLEAVAKPAAPAKPAVAVKKPVVKKPGEAAAPAGDKPAEGAPAAAEKPAEAAPAPAAEKPAEAPKPAAKPEEKPDEKDKNVKVPSWMKEGGEGSSGEKPQ
jgi:uncharacterized protein (TIGR02266 family)